MKDFFLIIIWPSIYWINNLLTELSLYIDPLRELKKNQLKKLKKKKNEEEEEEENKNDESSDSKEKNEEKKDENTNGYTNKITRGKKVTTK